MATLDQLDSLLLTGAAGLGPGFRSQQLGYLCRAQLPGGGFPGRQGGADLYYTDFALRLALLLGAEEVVWERAAGYLRRLSPPTDLISLFCLLNASRMLMAAEILLPLDREALRSLLATLALPTGGFAKAPGESVSAYATFIGAMCAEMLEVPLPAGADAVAAINGLQGPSGGYRESPGPGQEQTSATAAAVAFLNMQGALSDEAASAAARFIEAMQGPGGGLCAHADAPAEDLLSTFTGLVALVALPEAEGVDLLGLARFACDLAMPDGGFAATRHDAETDVEYTYYGVATLALLRAILPPAA